MSPPPPSRGTLPPPPKAPGRPQSYSAPPARPRPPPSKSSHGERTVDSSVSRIPAQPTMPSYRRSEASPAPSREMKVSRVPSGPPPPPTAKVSSIDISRRQPPPPPPLSTRESAIPARVQNQTNGSTDEFLRTAGASAAGSFMGAMIGDAMRGSGHRPSHEEDGVYRGPSPGYGGGVAYPSYDYGYDDGHSRGTDSMFAYCVAMGVGAAAAYAIFRRPNATRNMSRLFSTQAPRPGSRPQGSHERHSGIPVARSEPTSTERRRVDELRGAKNTAAKVLGSMAGRMVYDAVKKPK